MALLTEQEINACIGITDYTTGAMKKAVVIIDGAIYCGHELNENGRAMLLEVRTALEAKKEKRDAPYNI